MPPRRGRPPLGSPPPETELPELLNLWNLALISTHGIAISSNSPSKLSAKLYAARRDINDRRFDAFKVVECEGEVRICRR